MDRSQLNRTDKSVKLKKPKPAPVRQNLTSMYRMMKANPVLKYQLKGEPLPGNLNIPKTELRDEVPEKVLRKISSVESLGQSRSQKSFVRTQSVRQPVKKVEKPKAEVVKPDNEQKAVHFKMPMPYKMRSVPVATPETLRTSLVVRASTPGPSAYDLHKRLNDWLKKRGKPLKTFENLKKFGIRHDTITNNEENKENIETTIKNNSYEDLGIIVDEVKTEEAKLEEEVREDLRGVAKDALKDLKKLILEGYPREQCEAWLGTIRNKYNDLEEEPVYWECLAALEETVGHLTAAVQHYRKAIVHGAEVKEVDNSLEQMLQKFSLLDISYNNEHEKNSKHKLEREKIMLDARNAFKSTIIQFAIEQRKQKKGKNTAAEEKKKLVVTPVRRSTRRRTGYVLTPNVVYSSVEDVKELSSDELEFRHNRNLASKFF